MKDWIPLLQSLIWPVVTVGILVYFRRGVRAISEAAADRVRRGAAFEAGPSGFKLGAIQDPEPSQVLVAGATRMLQELPHPIYITHRAWRDAALDTKGQTYYKLLISIDADDLALLDRVSEVMYHLHPTFVMPDRLVTDRRTQFAFQTAAWGEFNMTAEIRFSDGKPPLLVERYINFLAPAT